MKRSRRTAPAVVLSPDVLDCAPHLGPLDIVSHALRVAAWSMYVENPTLMGDPHPFRPEPRDAVAARRLLRHMARFEQAIDRYRRALAPLLTPPPPQPDDDAAL